MLEARTDCSKEAERGPLAMLMQAKLSGWAELCCRFTVPEQVGSYPLPFILLMYHCRRQGYLM